MTGAAHKVYPTAPNDCPTAHHPFLKKLLNVCCPFFFATPGGALLPPPTPAPLFPTTVFALPFTAPAPASPGSSLPLSLFSALPPTYFFPLALVVAAAFFLPLEAPGLVMVAEDSLEEEYDSSAE